MRGALLPLFRTGWCAHCDVTGDHRTRRASDQEFLRAPYEYIRRSAGLPRALRAIPFRAHPPRAGGRARLISLRRPDGRAGYLAIAAGGSPATRACGRTGQRADPTARKVDQQAEEQARGELLIFGIAVALWSTSALARTLTEAFNAA